MKSLSYLVVLLAISRDCQCASSNTYPTGYYWSSFNGTARSDAFIAGINKGGKVILVGLVKIGKAGSIPGQLSPGSNKITVSTHPSKETGSPIYTETKNIKILCSKHPEHLCWVDSKHGESLKNIQGDRVKGGREFSERTKTYYPLDVARTQLDGNYVVAKSAPWPKTFGKMYYPSKGMEVHVSSVYQTLIHSTKCNCKGDESTDSTPASNIHCTKLDGGKKADAKVGGKLGEKDGTTGGAKAIGGVGVKGGAEAKEEAGGKGTNVPSDDYCFCEGDDQIDFTLS